MNKILICGCDEVGRGPIAGPVFAAAVIVPEGSTQIPSVKDSKLLSKRKREDLSRIIQRDYVFALGEASVLEIEAINILNATKLAITRAVENLKIAPNIVLVDGNMKFADARFQSIIKGDRDVYSISCASIVAKVHRDQLMHKIAMSYPEYGFDKNSGYGTKAHFAAIEQYGPTIHHRPSFLAKFFSKLEGLPT